MEMALQDAMRVCNPDIKTPFQSIEDAVNRCATAAFAPNLSAFLFRCGIQISICGIWISIDQVYRLICGSVT